MQHWLKMASSRLLGSPILRRPLHLSVSGLRFLPFFVLRDASYIPSLAMRHGTLHLSQPPDGAHGKLDATEMMA